MLVAAARTRWAQPRVKRRLHQCAAPLSRRHISSKPKPPPPPQEAADAALRSLADAIQHEPAVADALVKKLSATAKKELAAAWKICENGSDGAARGPQAWQLRRLALLASLPMIGFGFMDNLVMILAGDYFDSTIAFRLGLTTMCAAGVGNVISDMLGVFAAGPIESTLRNVGVQGPGLSPRQMQMTSVLSAKYLGSAVGVGLGAAVGMFPLLWPEDKRLWLKRSERKAATPDEV